MQRSDKNVTTTLHEPLLALDKEFNIQMANRAFYKIFEITEEETLGENLFELQGGHWDIAGLRKELQKIRKEKGLMTEVEIEHTFSTIGCHDICFNIQMLYKEGAEPLILLALRDITERKKGQQGHQEAKDKMEENAEMIQTLYLNSPAFMCTYMGPEHIYDLVNPAYQKLFGKRKIKDKTSLEALPELEEQGINKMLDKVYETGEPFIANQAQVWAAYDEGLSPAERYFNFSCQPMYGEDKKIIGVLGFGYEVTNEVIAKKREEANLRLILESIPQITITANAEGKIIFFNKYALDYSGLNGEEATTGKGWEKIIHPEELQSVVALAEACLITGKDFYKELRLKRKRDGKYRWHLLRATSIKDGNGGVIASWVGVATDIQEQKIKEEKKDEFMNIASHEMKTPLASIKGYLQLLEMTLDKDTDSTLYVNKALVSVNRLNNLITELLEVGKSQNGKLNYEITTFDFNKMLVETINDERKTSSDYTIIKKGSITSEIKGDHDRLQQVIINLLSNAIKYSPNEKKIVVTAKEKNGELIISVKDNGIGISKENLEHIFKRYFRVEDQAMRFQGMGIGLYLSNEIIKRHKGKMWVESEIGKGSTFYFSIPAGGRKSDK
ncbi:MAG: ATP-binding protein [Ginsengibacter sp.]